MDGYIILVCYIDVYPKLPETGFTVCFSTQIGNTQSTYEDANCTVSVGDTRRCPLFPPIYSYVIIMNEVGIMYGTTISQLRTFAPLITLS